MLFDNMVSHYLKAHLEHPVVFDECPICSKIIAPELVLCDSHSVEDIRKTLIPLLYLPFRKFVSELLGRNDEVVHNHLFRTLPEMLHAKVVNGEPDVFDFVRFYGYSLSRRGEVFGKISQENLPSSSVRIEEEQERILGSYLLVEYNMLKLIHQAYLNLVQVAFTEETGHRNLYLVPNISESAARNTLRVYLHEHEIDWSRAQKNIVWPRDVLPFSDSFGRQLHLRAKEITSDFELFKQKWADSFGNPPSFPKRDLLRIVYTINSLVSSQGILSSDLWQTKDHEDSLKETLNQVTIDINNISHISDVAVVKSLELLEQSFEELLNVGLGSRLGKNPTIYYLVIPSWFKIKLRRVLYEFAKEKQIIGSIFENELSNWLKLYQNRGIGLQPSRAGFGTVVAPQTQIPTSISLSFRGVLESNLDFTVPDSSPTSAAGNEGEIDAIIHANHSLYLLELKAIDMNSTQANRYLKAKAGIQCGRYAEWARENTEFTDLLSAHKLNSMDIHDLRIITCTWGVTDQFFVHSSETDDMFAVMPFSTILGLFGGVVIADPFGMEVDHYNTLANAIALTRKRIEIKHVIAPEKRYNLMMDLLFKWIQLATLDRRIRGNAILDHPQPNILNRGKLTWMERLLGDTGKWVFDSPLKIDEVDGISVYLGTQISVEGSTLLCFDCKAAVKYYKSPKEEDQEKISSIFSDMKCPLCGGVATPSIEAKDAYKKIAHCFPEFSSRLLKTSFVDPNWLMQ